MPSELPSGLLLSTHKKNSRRGGYQNAVADRSRHSRRRFLQYLAGSPLLASGALTAYGLEAPSKLPDPMIWAPPGSGELISRPKGRDQRV